MLRLSGYGNRIDPEVMRHWILAHRAVIRNRGEGMNWESVGSPPSHAPLTRQNTLPRKMRYEVPS